MGLLAGFIGGAITRTVGGAVNRYNDAKRAQMPATRGLIQQPTSRPQMPTTTRPQVPQQGGGRRTLQQKYATEAWKQDAFGNWTLKAGYIVNRKGQIQKKPTMNVANPYAAVRALRRVRGFEKIARQIVKVTPKFKRNPRAPRRRGSCK